MAMLHSSFFSSHGLRISLLALLLSLGACAQTGVVNAPVAPLLPASATVANTPLVSFASEDGMARLARTPARGDFAPLVNQFEAQSNTIFCGPTTAAIVLNALRPEAAVRDGRRLAEQDFRYLPPGAEIAVPRFTQEGVIAKGLKTRAQVLGEPMPVHGKEIKDFGYQLRQFDEMLRANGLVTRMVVVSNEKPEGEIRADLLANLAHAGDYVAVNYQRAAVGQKGGGHISPLAAYDAASDSVLVLDVNPAAAGWVWMPLATLIKGMRTFDTVENRGYVLIERP